MRIICSETGVSLFIQKDDGRYTAYTITRNKASLPKLTEDEVKSAFAQATKRNKRHLFRKGTVLPGPSFTILPGKELDTIEQAALLGALVVLIQKKERRQ